jgi:hypothetical protein
MKVMDCASSVLDCRTRKFKHGRLSGGNDLHAEHAQGRAKVAFIGNRKVGQQRSVTAQTASDTDRIRLSSEQLGCLPPTTETIDVTDAFCVPHHSSGTIDSP